MQDKLEKFGRGSVIQHGRVNNRVYLMKLNKADFPEVLEYIENLTISNSYTKIFCKVPFWAVPGFMAKGFAMEAYIPNFYKNRADVFFVSKFLDAERASGGEYDKLEGLSRLLIAYRTKKTVGQANKSVQIKVLKGKDVNEISNLYKKTFDSYPFPIFDSAYISQTMKNNVQYFGIEAKGRLVALSSAEIDPQGKNAEMTDFATLPDYRGGQSATRLLSEMERVMEAQGITTLYSIARLNSPAMSKTFLKHSYKYAGTLINNTNISGKIESMNVFYKHI
ncbi:MAG: putative beta-lysine N-acetyltransferase [Proteobacteria bacterium]|nr:putative beta-lysine N-acetyltransferase [Pseudomonadota bacterium]MBU1686982.1 putative beta-lysine N-acetyltransferase [Pseudomonadota bacterium]